LIVVVVVFPRFNLVAHYVKFASGVQFKEICALFCDATIDYCMSPLIIIPDLTLRSAEKLPNDLEVFLLKCRPDEAEDSPVGVPLIK